MKAKLAALFITSLMAQNLYATTDSYVAQASREIKNFSAQDVQQIKQGKGWGMAKSAEFNGYPGPRHVLDMAEKLALSAEQTRAVKDIFEAMQVKAMAAGDAYLAAERQLDQGFLHNQINAESLRELVDTSLQARADLRYIHQGTYMDAR